MLAGVASSTASILPTSASASLRKSPWNIWARGRGWGEGPGEARAAGSSGAQVRVRHQDLKRETPVIAQQGLDGVEVELELREAAGSVLLGQMRIPWAGKGGSTCGSVASALSSGAFSVVRTRPAGKANKVVSRQARPGASETAHLACSSGRRRDEIPLRGWLRGTAARPDRVVERL